MSKIDQFRKIVETQTAAKVSGQMCDLFSAGLVVQVYDKLNDKNKERFEQMHPTQMILAALKLSKASK